MLTVRKRRFKKWNILFRSHCWWLDELLIHCISSCIFDQFAPQCAIIAQNKPFTLIDIKEKNDNCDKCVSDKLQKHATHKCVYSVSQKRITCVHLNFSLKQCNQSLTHQTKSTNSHPCREKDSTGVNTSSLTTNCEQLFLVKELVLNYCPLAECLWYANKVWLYVMFVIQNTLTKALTAKRRKPKQLDQRVRFLSIYVSCLEQYL